ncbi:MAG TPA: OmpA family protein [Steroidobacteraceae bacterium]|nr:OmpA family protein [Steroidobacteraceae bacterium]
MYRQRMKHSFVVVAASALLALAACETQPDPSAMLEQARSAITQAEADPNVARYATTELDRARKLLVDAERAAGEKAEGGKTASHYAYLTTQMVRIAQQRAQEQVAITHLRAGETERQKILLSTQPRPQAQVESERLAAQLENLQASQTSRGIVLTLDEGLFDMSKAQLKPGAERSIDQITAFLNQNPDRRVQVEGFTDSQGTNDFNIEVSQTRADTVAMAIIHRGIDAERVRAIGYGEGYQMNRRVEIIVSNSDAAIPGRTAGAP